MFLPHSRDNESIKERNIKNAWAVLLLTTKAVPTPEFVAKMPLQIESFTSSYLISRLPGTWLMFIFCRASKGSSWLNSVEGCLLVTFS